MTDCIVWQHGKSNGYGKTRDQKYAHREAYIKAYGNIPSNLEIDHLCRNRGCVNPSHLQAVTHKENIRRCKKLYGKAEEIRAKHSTGNYTQRQLGREYGVHEATISDIICGESWT